MNAVELAQSGVLTDPTSHVEYLAFDLTGNRLDSDTISSCIGAIANVSKSIGQKDTTSGLSITIGFSLNAWKKMFPDQRVPEELHDFIELKNGPRHFPSTNGDIFFMIKSSRIDLNYQAAKFLRYAFNKIAVLTDDIQGYKYLDDRDMIDFVDGTENPKGNERAQAVIIPSGDYAGGSYLILQKYLDKQDLWDALTTEEQEGVIGRTKMDDIEIDDDKKKPYAHNVKSKVEINGEEKKMLRQNRAFGNALEHGTIFVGFAASPSIIETSLKQMITADEDGNYDKLLDFVDAVKGANYFIPPQSFLDAIAG